MSIILFFIILGVLVVSHEFGHFIVAKWSGMRVDEFGFGFPPRLFGIKKGETTYSINWIPFGGFVKIWGEDAPENAHELPEYSRSFAGKPKHLQAAVVAAGVFFNLLLAWLLISLGFMLGMPVSTSQDTFGKAENPRVFITQVFKDSPAATAGLQPGDVITGIGTQTNLIEAQEVQSFIASQTTPSSFPLTYSRGNESRTVMLEAVLKNDLGQPAIGIALDSLGTVHLGPIQAIASGLGLTIDLTKETALGLLDFVKNLFTERKPLEGVSGPVGIIGLVGVSALFGFVHLLGLTAVISINLALMNMIPFPALDGGRFLFIIIEKIKGSPITPRIANSMNAAGFFALLALMVFITFHDVVNLITG